MIDNQWSDPAGVSRYSPPIKYRVFDRQLKQVVERFTEVSYDHHTDSTHHALNARDQHIAEATTAVIQRACAYFYVRDDATYERDYALEGVRDIVVSDDEVRERVRRLELGENYREAARIGNNGGAKNGYYKLSELPWERQRAMVEQLLAIRRQWQFEIIGPASEEEVKKLRSVAAAFETPDFLG